MSNLLEKASILTTPTAYNDGKILSVKPNTSAGDFDFTRNSSATRVNAQGLVEDVQILSSNLVQNGDFSEEGVEEVSNGDFSQEGSELITNGNFATDSDWNKQTSNWTIVNGYAVCDGLQTSNSSLFQDVAVVNGKSYKIDFTITDSANDLNLILGATTIGQYGAGTHSIYVTKDSNASARIFFQATASNAFQGSLDNVSVKEVGQDWDIEDTWTIGDGVANGNGALGSTSELKQYNVNTIGKTYKATFEVLNYVSGTVGFWQGSGISVINRSADGIYTEYFTATSAEIRFRPNNFNGSITNISVKEVGQDWILGTGITIEENKAIFTSTASGQSVSQNAVASSLTNGALAKVSFEVLTRTEGSFGVYFSGTLVGTLSSAGVFTAYFTKGTETSFYIRALGTTSGSISNISVIEITDDTNLPRINYEGFSYQDALGSELITNGSFDTDSDWTTNDWNISGGSLNGSASTGIVFQNNLGVVVGKTYKVVLEISNYTSGLIRFKVGGASYQSIASEDGVQEFYFVAATSDNNILFSVQSAYTGSIDNISIKEYLGQEVVPDSGVGSWLFEPQSTNLLPYSSDFSLYTLSSVNLISNIVLSPDNSLTASKIYPTSSGNYRHIKWAPQNPASGLNTFSIFAKAGELEHLVLIDYDGSGVGVDYNLSTGVATDNSTTPFDSVKMIDYGNGWYRCAATATNAYFYYILSDNGGLSVTANGTDGLYIWGAQVEAQSYATSYIPTSGSTVTRLQDAAFGAGSSDLINSTEGVLYAEIMPSPLQCSFALSDGSIDNRVSFNYQYGIDIRTNIRIGGTQKKIIGGGNISDSFHKIAVRWDDSTNILSFYKDGGLVNTVSYSGSLGVNTLNNVSFTQGDGTSSNFFGKTKCVAVFKEALTDEELTCLTTI